jgi:uncharacterized Zn finger protein
MKTREIKNECTGSGPTAVSSHERFVLGFTHCSSCGKVIKIRQSSKEENDVYIPRHSRAK